MFQSFRFGIFPKPLRDRNDFQTCFMAEKLHKISARDLLPQVVCLLNVKKVSLKALFQVSFYNYLEEHLQKAKVNVKNDPSHQEWNQLCQSSLGSSLLRFTPLQLPQTNHEGFNLAEKVLKWSCAYFPLLCLEAMPLQGFKFTAHTRQTALPVCKAALHTERATYGSLTFFLSDNGHIWSLLTCVSFLLSIFQGVKMSDCLFLLFPTEIKSLSLYHLQLQRPNLLFHWQAPSFLLSRPLKKTKTLACCVTTSNKSCKPAKSAHPCFRAFHKSVVFAVYGPDGPILTLTGSPNWSQQQCESVSSSMDLHTNVF